MIQQESFVLFPGTEMAPDSKKEKSKLTKSIPNWILVIFLVISRHCIEQVWRGYYIHDREGLAQLLYILYIQRFDVNVDISHSFILRRSSHARILFHQGPFHKHRLILIPSWISNHMPCKVWGEITYPFQNFNGFAIEVLEWKSNFFTDFTGSVITYPCWYSKLIHVSKMGYRSTWIPDAVRSPTLRWI